MVTIRFVYPFHLDVGFGPTQSPSHTDRSQNGKFLMLSKGCTETSGVMLCASLGLSEYSTEHCKSQFEVSRPYLARDFLCSRDHIVLLCVCV